MQVLKNLYSKIVNINNPSMPYSISMLVIAAAGIVISAVSGGSLINIIKKLLTNKSYIGNQPYLAAVSVTLIICISILIWGVKSIITSILEMVRHRPPPAAKFKDYSEVEQAFVQKQIHAYKTALGYMLEKDKTFIKGLLVFFALVVLFFIAKIFLPDTFFWNLRLTPQYFSFPIFFILMLAGAAVLRWSSIRSHRSIENQEIEGGQVLKSIKTGTDPAAFVPGIEKALIPIQQNGASNMVHHSGFSETGDTVKESGKIYQKLFVETQPQPVQYVHHIVMYLYLAASVILIVTGFLFMAKLPPDNISVLTVPTIAIGYVWGIIKGAVLVLSGAGFLTAVSRIYKAYRFKSVMVYVEIDGVYEADARHSDCDFNVFTTTLMTEINRSDSDRRIIKMTAEQDSESAKKMVAVAVESFMIGQTINGNSLTTPKEEE